MGMPSRSPQLAVEAPQAELGVSDQRPHAEDARELDRVLEESPRGVRFHGVEPQGNLSEKAERPRFIPPFVTLSSELERLAGELPGRRGVASVEKSLAQARE